MKIDFLQETTVPVFALAFASAVSVALVLARILWTQELRYGFLAGNLFLAWLPLLFAFRVCDLYQKGEHRSWRFFGLACAWLLFFPNAPYIFTDLIHVATASFRHFWVDMMLVLMCALTGLVLGFVSLYLMQSLIVRIAGRIAGWIFVAAVTGLSGFGIYLGRFLRLNSWDVLIRPVKLCHGIGSWAAHPFARATTFAFPALFAAFLFVAYVMLFALTHLPRSNEFAASIKNANPFAG